MYGKVDALFYIVVGLKVGPTGEGIFSSLKSLIKNYKFTNLVFGTWVVS